jgi:deazaflavin-dependent oxidoreductase (nitroreductase family)
VAEQMPDVETIKSFNTGLVEEFRANGGKVGDKYKGANLSLLTTTGAKTGQPRITPLAYFRFDGKLIIIGSSWGAQSHPAWVRNLWANPSVHVGPSPLPSRTAQSCHQSQLAVSPDR